jgi:large subunit ribosomal protein L12e
VKHEGNLTLEQVKKVAKIMEERSLSKEFKGTVLQTLGTWYESKGGAKYAESVSDFPLFLFSSSIGCTVNGEHPKKIIAKIQNGEIDV